MDSCPPQGEAGDDIDDYGPDFISVVQNAPGYEHYDETWLIGVIRGSKRTPLRFEGPCVNVKDLGRKETTQNVPGRPRPPPHRAVG